MMQWIDLLLFYKIIPLTTKSIIIEDKHDVQMNDEREMISLGQHEQEPIVISELSIETVKEIVIITLLLIDKLIMVIHINLLIHIENINEVSGISE